MRKITQQAAEALMSFDTFKSGNTKVAVEDGVATLYLHDNAIATHDSEGVIAVTNAGWFSNTTKDRLNGIPGVDVRQIKGEWFLNGEIWDGEVVQIG